LAERGRGTRQRVAVAEDDDVGFVRTPQDADAKLRADAGRFARDQREPGTHGSVAGRGGRVAGADVDVGLAAHLAQEAVPLVLQLALADALAHLRAAVVVGDVGLAHFLALDDVPAGLGLERRRDLAVLQGDDLGPEFGPELVLREPAQLAALVLAEGVVRAFLGHLGEVRAAGDARAQGVDPGLGRRVVLAFGAHQDMARAVLGDALPGGLVARARLHQLQQLEAARTADGSDHLSRLQAA